MNHQLWTILKRLLSLTTTAPPNQKRHYIHYILYTLSYI
jgi:hypothetical protein